MEQKAITLRDRKRQLRQDEEDLMHDTETFILQNVHTIREMPLAQRFQWLHTVVNGSGEIVRETDDPVESFTVNPNQVCEIQGLFRECFPEYLVYWCDESFNEEAGVWVHFEDRKRPASDDNRISVRPKKKRRIVKDGAAASSSLADL